MTAPRCPHCLDEGSVCEDHPQFPAHINVEGHRGAECGAGMPCPACCSPIPEDGTVSITQAFVPAWKRGPCCDMHGRNCEPPGDLCCWQCTEARHGGWRDDHGNLRFGHLIGEECSNPVLSLPVAGAP